MDIHHLLTKPKKPTMSTNLILDRASKNLQAVLTSAAKATADLQTLTVESIAQAEKIEDLKAEAKALQGANDTARREAAAELKLRVKEDRVAVLTSLLKEDKLAHISEVELATLRQDLQLRINADDKELKAAVAAAVGAAQRDAQAAAAQVAAQHRVEMAEKDALNQQQTSQLTFMTAQIADLRKQIDDERAARIAIAQADSAKQGVTVNTGK